MVGPCYLWKLIMSLSYYTGCLKKKSRGKEFEKFYKKVDGVFYTMYSHILINWSFLSYVEKKVMRL